MRPKYNKHLLIKTLKLVFHDFFMLALSYLFLFWISKSLGYEFNNVLLISLTGGLIIIQILIFFIFSIYNMLLSYFGFSDIIKISVIIIITKVVFSLVFLIINLKGYFLWNAILLITPLQLLLISGPRSLPRIIRHYKSIYSKEKEIPTLIVGAGAGGTLVLKEILTNVELNQKVVGFIDDDLEKVGSKLNGIPVLGPVSSLTKIINEEKIKEVIIAIGNITAEKLAVIVKELSKTTIKAKKIQVIEDVDKKSPISIVDVKIEDLLKREQVELHNQGLNKCINNKVILVTGGGGSIGSELCRQIVKYKPKGLIIFDIFENNAYEIQMELKRYFYKHNIKDINLEVIIGSVYNKYRVKELLKTYKPNIIFHAAAYKHVPLMEASPVEAIRTNVIGTYNLAIMADIYKVDKFVLVSTDKAVRPTNIMGASKRFAEHIIQQQNELSTTTSYSAVRFGNVLGSAGSVIPLFTKQIKDGGPVTITHKDITRYFMTIPEAVSLILLSGVYAKGGEIFVLDMGEPVKIKDLATSMIRLSGLKPYKDIEIIFTGLRPGEKLYEELLINKDNQTSTSNNKIFIESESYLTYEELKIKEIVNNIDKYSNNEIINLIKKIITTYKPNP